MRIAGTVPESVVDGPGIRYTIFTQGCPHNCESCHNPQTHTIDGGYDIEVSALLKKILTVPSLVTGVTISGGEPFVQAEDCAALAQAVKDKGLNVWVYSGWTFEELFNLSLNNEGAKKLLNNVDVLVDGRFVMGDKSFQHVWRGSKNQRLIDVQKTLQGYSIGNKQIIEWSEVL